MSDKKTAIHILPSWGKDKEEYLVLYLDDEALTKYQAGEDTENVEMTVFYTNNHDGKTITKIIIELIDGKPISVQKVEE